jgi:hypothetical protein
MSHVANYIFCCFWPPLLDCGGLPLADRRRKIGGETSMKLRVAMAGGLLAAHFLRKGE